MLKHLQGTNPTNNLQLGAVLVRNVSSFEIIHDVILYKYLTYSHLCQLSLNIHAMSPVIRLKGELIGEGELEGRTRW